MTRRLISLNISDITNYLSGSISRDDFWYTQDNNLIIDLTEPDFEFPKWMGPEPRKNAVWTDLEYQRLIRSFEIGVSVNDLCIQHGRNLQGILSKLELKYPNIKIRYENEIKKDFLEKELRKILEQAEKLKKEIKELE